MFNSYELISHTITKVMNITTSQLIELFENDPQSANFGSIEICTDARSNYKINHEDGSKFPYAKGELQKVARYQVNFGVRYSDAMNRAMNNEYEAGTSWHTPYKFKSGKFAKNLVQSKKSGEVYICFMPDFEKSSSFLKEANTGKVIPFEAVAKFKKPSEERVVPYLTCKVSNIKRIAIRGQVISVSDNQ